MICPSFKYCFLFPLVIESERVSPPPDVHGAIRVWGEPLHCTRKLPPKGYSKIPLGGIIGPSS